MMTNQEFGQLIGLTTREAGRLRKGAHLPSVRTLGNVHRGLGISLEALHAAYDRGPEAFGSLIESVIGPAPPSTKLHRNEQMVAEREAGASWGDLAERHNVSKRRAVEIVQKQRRAAA